jgi:hypothetical protein
VLGIHSPTYDLDRWAYRAHVVDSNAALQAYVLPRTTDAGQAGVGGKEPVSLSGESSAVVEALDPAATHGGALTAGVGRVAGRADIDRDGRCGRAGCERRSARRALDVDEVQVWMMGHEISLITSERRISGDIPLHVQTLGRLLMFPRPFTVYVNVMRIL